MQNNLKRINFISAFFALVFVMLISFVTPMKVSAAPKLNKKQVELKIGKTCKLKVKGTSNKVKWSTSNKKIAKVSKNGVITAKKAGKVTIKAKVGKKTLKCKVTVLCKKHQFEERIIRKATTKRPGEKCKVCKVCGFETEHEEIPRLKTKSEEESDDNDEEESDTQDGPDNTESEDENNSEGNTDNTPKDDDSSYVPRQEGLTELEVKNRLAELKSKYSEVPSYSNLDYISFIIEKLYGNNAREKNTNEAHSKMKAGDLLLVFYDFEKDDGTEVAYCAPYIITDIVNGEDIYTVSANHQDFKSGLWDPDGSPSFTYTREYMQDGLFHPRKLVPNFEHDPILVINLRPYY